MKRLLLFIIGMVLVLPANAYHWTPNSDQYPQTASVVGVISIDGVEQTSLNLELGAFCGNECRGREKPIYVSQLNRYLLFLTLYGNDGDELSFRLYDHSLGQELDMACSSTITFVMNETFGTVDAPFVFDMSAQYNYHWTLNSSPYANTATVVGVISVDGVEQTSTDLELGAFCGNECRGRETLIYVSQLNRYLLFLTLFGYNSDELTFRLYDHGLGQELNLSCSSTITFVTDGSFGSPASPFVFGFTNEAPTPPSNPVVITLRPGWNWISNLLTTEKALEVALANLTPSDGDVLKGQNAFCTYSGGTQSWWGSLNTLVPGEGYMYLNNSTETKTFTYPAP